MEEVPSEGLMEVLLSLFILMNHVLIRGTNIAKIRTKTCHSVRKNGTADFLRIRILKKEKSYE